MRATGVGDCVWNDLLDETGMHHRSFQVVYQRQVGAHAPLLLRRAPSPNAAHQPTPPVLRTDACDDEMR